MKSKKKVHNYYIETILTHCIATCFHIKTIVKGTYNAKFT